MFAVAGSAMATSLGLNNDPAGSSWDRGDAGTAYAIWDTYPDFTFTGDVSDSGSGFTSATRGQSITLTGSPASDQGAGVYGSVAGTGTAGNDVLLTGGRGANFAFSIDSPFAIKQFYLQIKRSSTTTSLATLTPTLGGFAPDSITSTSGSGDTTSDSGSYSVTTFYWGNSIAAANLTSGVPLAVAIPTQRALDTFVVDAASIPVPEPVSLGAVGLASLLLIRRRK